MQNRSVDLIYNRKKFNIYKKISILVFQSFVCVTYVLFLIDTKACARLNISFAQPDELGDLTDDLGVKNFLGEYIQIGAMRNSFTNNTSPIYLREGYENQFGYAWFYLPWFSGPNKLPDLDFIFGWLGSVSIISERHKVILQTYQTIVIFCANRGGNVLI